MNDKKPEPKHICDGHYDLNYKCSICGKHISEPREEDKENMMFGVFSKETHVLVKREKIEFWRKELLNKTEEVLKSMREVLGIE